jgi:cytochrome oxidase Cu insertion factor (SCO1/SenC/PrrC family)
VFRWLLPLGCLSSQLLAQPLGPKDGADLPPTDTARVAVGSVAPDFTLATFTGESVTLSELRGKKNVILVFYRGHW